MMCTCLRVIHRAPDQHGAIHPRPHRRTPATRDLYGDPSRTRGAYGSISAGRNGRCVAVEEGRPPGRTPARLPGDRAARVSERRITARFVVIDDIMRFLDQPYYVGLLTAAAIHGAAHHRPQEFQVVTDRPTRQITVGRVRIRFVQKCTIHEAAVQEVKTETGTMPVSTPEET